MAQPPSLCNTAFAVCLGQKRCRRRWPVTATEAPTMGMPVS